MSATYRIEVTFDVHAPIVPWAAKVVRLSDDWPCYVSRERTHAEALRDARLWIQADTASQDDETHYLVDDQGRDAEAPQSVKVPDDEIRSWNREHSGDE